jgi:hypothetical protein
MYCVIEKDPKSGAVKDIPLFAAAAANDCMRFVQEEFRVDLKMAGLQKGTYAVEIHTEPEPLVYADYRWVISDKARYLQICVPSGEGSHS